MRRNPNNYGSVTKLSGNRSRPWIAKITIHDEEGRGRQVPIGYAATEEEANILLAQYNHDPWDLDRDKITLAELFKRWSQTKLPSMSKSMQGCMKAAFKHCSKYYPVPYRKMRSYHMQDCVDSCVRGYSTKNTIKTLFTHLDSFAFELDIIDKQYSQLVISVPIPETSRKPFSLKEIDALWKRVEAPWIDSILIYLYTGLRLNELLEMAIEQVDLEEGYLKGGSKTEAGKNRIIPIHDKIRPLIEARYDPSAKYLIERNGHPLTHAAYYEEWYQIMDELQMHHTPHEARHTFETLLDNAGGNRKCIDMLMGHKSQGTGNRVYNHKTLDQLRETINLLQ